MLIIPIKYFRLFTLPIVLLSANVFSGDVNVYAAASLTDVINELANTYQQQHPEVRIKPIYAGSATLAKQIENGAPADVFLSADLDWADYLEKKNLFIQGSRKSLLGNSLVFIAPKGKEFKIEFNKAFNFVESFKGKLCTGEPAYVPVGKYAQQALTHYDWWDKIKPRIVGTEDVRTVTAFVERGECPLGIVYSTDAKMSNKVNVIATFPKESHKAIIYPGALLKKSSDESKAFWAYLRNDEARAVFVKYGFTVFP